MLARIPHCIAVLTLMSACTPSPSEESRAMEATLIPELVAVSKRGGVFRLGSALSGNYDAICVVSEYNCLHDVRILANLNELRSSFGWCVPENHSAVVLVAEGRGHAALVESWNVTFAGPSQGQCVSASGALLRVSSGEGARGATVTLQEG